MGMNRYGQQALEAWRRYAPRALDDIPDPQTHFTELGEQVQAQVDVVMQLQEQQLGPNLPYKERVQGLMSARREAEDQVMHDFVWDPIGADPSGWPIREELAMLIGDLPEPYSLLLRQARIAADAAERNGTDDPSGTLTWMEEEQRELDLLDQLHQHLIEVDVDSMTEPEMVALISRLRQLQAGLAALRG